MAHKETTIHPKQWWQGSQFWLLLAVIGTLIVMLPNLNNGWVNWDDQDYVEKNTQIHSLTSKNVKAIFTNAEYKGNYHPLTLLSLAFDYTIYGRDAQGYHLTNVLLHLANVVLVFWFIYLLCGRTKIAGIVALLFGIHPMHLESVAWISARKDVLYSFFFLLGLVNYLRYFKVTTARWRPYLLTLLLFFTISSLQSYGCDFPSHFILYRLFERQV